MTSSYPPPRQASLLHLSAMARPFVFMGPKCSMYYMLLSIWGVIMLTLMGIFFKVRSPSLFEDIKSEGWKYTNFSMEYIQEQYDTNAINCWIAAALYASLFLFAFIQQKLYIEDTVNLS